MDTEQLDDSNLVKDLRKQLKDALAERQRVSEELAAVKGERRKATVTEFLKAKGVNPKAAQFIPDDVDGDEALTQWLDENADVFGVAAAAESEGSGVSTEAAAATRRANALQERAVSPDKVADLQARIENADSVDELNAALSDLRKYTL